MEKRVRGELAALQTIFEMDERSLRGAGLIICIVGLGRSPRVWFDLVASFDEIGVKIKEFQPQDLALNLILI